MGFIIFALITTFCTLLCGMELTSPSTTTSSNNLSFFNDETKKLTVPPKNDPQYAAVERIFDASKVLQDSIQNLGHESKFGPGTEFYLPALEKDQFVDLLEFAKIVDSGKWNGIEVYIKKFSIKKIINIMSCADFLDMKTIIDVSAKHIATWLRNNPERFNQLSSISPLILKPIQEKLISLIVKSEHRTLKTDPYLTFALRILSPSGKKLAVGTEYGLIKIWDLTTNKELAILFKDDEYSVVSMAFSNDEKILAAIISEKSIQSIRRVLKLFNLKTNLSVTYSDSDFAKTSCSVVAFRSNETLAMGFEDGTIKLWEVNKLWNGNFSTPIKTISCGVPSFVFIRLLAFSSNGNKFALGSVNIEANPYKSTIIVGDLTIEGRETKNNIIEHEGVAYSLALSPDGGMLAVGFTKRFIKIWDLATNKILATLHGHVGYVSSITFSSKNNAILTSASYDRKTKLWFPNKSFFNTLSFQELIDFAKQNAEGKIKFINTRLEKAEPLPTIQHSIANPALSHIPTPTISHPPTTTFFQKYKWPLLALGGLTAIVSGYVFKQSLQKFSRVLFFNFFDKWKKSVRVYSA